MSYYIGTASLLSTGTVPSYFSGLQFSGMIKFSEGGSLRPSIPKIDSFINKMGKVLKKLEK